MFPNMYPEVLDAVHLMYEDNPDVEADCMLYLMNLHDNERGLAQLEGMAMKRLEDMGRCTICGEQLQPVTYYLAHPEISPGCQEEIVDQWCPNCNPRSVM